MTNTWRNAAYIRKLRNKTEQNTRKYCIKTKTEYIFMSVVRDRANPNFKIGGTRIEWASNNRLKADWPYTVALRHRCVGSVPDISSSALGRDNLVEHVVWLGTLASLLFVDGAGTAKHWDELRPPGGSNDYANPRTHWLYADHWPSEKRSTGGSGTIRWALGSGIWCNVFPITPNTITLKFSSICSV